MPLTEGDARIVHHHVILDGTIGVWLNHRTRPYSPPPRISVRLVPFRGCGCSGWNTQQCSISRHGLRNCRRSGSLIAACAIDTKKIAPRTTLLTPRKSLMSVHSHLLTKKANQLPCVAYPHRASPAPQVVRLRRRLPCSSQITEKQTAARKTASPFAVMHARVVILQS